jgi:hypothetical protein
LLLPLQLLLLAVCVGADVADPLPPSQHGLHACDLSLPGPTSSSHYNNVKCRYTLVQTFLSSCLLYKTIKISTHRNITLPVVLYGCKT